MIFTTDIVVGRAKGTARGIILRHSPSAPSSPSVLVAGAGTAEVNGTYTERGTNGARPYYNLVGQPDDLRNSSITWDGTAWIISLSDGTGAYNNSEEDVDFPWDSAEWQPIDGAEPVPTVTEA